MDGGRLCTAAGVLKGVGGEKGCVREGRVDGGDFAREEVS